MRLGFDGSDFDLGENLSDISVYYIASVSMRSALIYSEQQKNLFAWAESVGGGGKSQNPSFLKKKIK